MEFKADANPRISLTLDGKAEVTFTAQRGVLSLLESMKDKELLIKVATMNKKRTLSQNAYLWALLGEVAEKMRISKEDAYRNYVKDYGVYEVLPIKKEAAERFINTWEKHGLGWVCEVLKESKLAGYVNVIAYYGSSSYDSQSMARLLEAVIEDCEELGISTMTMKDIALLRNDNDVSF